MRSARARFVAVLTAVLLVLSLSGPGTPPSSGHDPFPLSWLWDWLPGPLGHGGSGRKSLEKCANGFPAINPAWCSAV